MAPSGGGNIKVVVRVRPFNKRELDRNAQCVIHMKDGQTTVNPPSGDHRPRGNKASLEGSKSFAYDHSYWSFDRSDPNFAGQEQLFEDLGRPLLDNAFQGYNNCIFAYGQTGSGKSYSMMGFGLEAGVIPRICKDMFDRIDELQNDKNITCTVEVSYLEIYNERVKDLLNPSTKGNLKVREHPSTGPYVEDLAKLVVRSFQEIESLMDEGNKARTVAATNMNETSSRSHAVFTLSLTQKKCDEETKMSMERAAKISLVDLAGSERATSTGATGARLKEGAEINRSLSTLGRVIAALADLSTGKKKNPAMIPYRDSVLTWLLKDSLGGNSMTAMIAAISPADINFEETLSTLRYADSAKRIKNHAIVNEDANARMIRELKEELAQLRAKLGGAPGVSGNDTAAGDPGDLQYPPGTPLDKQMVYLTQSDGTTREVSKADIAEQLSQSEKLYQDLNQTWEQKLQKTEEIHKEREAALEELGISIEKGFVGLSTPKKMPHLVNLSDDPLLAECLVYNLKPGNTLVGNYDMTTAAEIRLKGSKILQEHCLFENIDGVVSILPHDDAAVMVNGIKVEQKKRLHSGYRVILGDFHIFRFNHPQEARAERAEQGSMLKHSSVVGDAPWSVETPTRARSRSSFSQTAFSREKHSSQSPSPVSFNEQDYDWSFARREAATAILGSDQKIANLTDEELDILYEDLQRVRAGRRGRPESLITDREYDSDSVASYPLREKYMSSAAFDAHSLDTALTAPSTPSHGEAAERRKLCKENLRTSNNRETLSIAEQESESETGLHFREKESDTQYAESEVVHLKEEMRRQLEEQKKDYEHQIEQLKPAFLAQRKDNEMSPIHKRLARKVLQKWRQRKYVRMAAILMQYASVIKEAQIMAQQMGQMIIFQFCILEIGQSLGSSYDMVLNGVADQDDEDLAAATRPSVAVRVLDFQNCAIYLWSLLKLEKRLNLMREMQQFLDRPDYLQHFKIGEPFTESCLPRYSSVGEAQVSLAAVFESRVQDYELDIISPYTFEVVGILKMSLEPSLANASATTLKFNVVIHEITGISEMEGTEIHAQLFLHKSTDDEGVTTTQIISGFNEGSIVFESLHGLSIPMSSSRDSRLHVSVFARVSTMHLDRLVSWDDMRDFSGESNSNVKQNSRLAEYEFNKWEKYDVFTRVQILELSEDGTYLPVEVLQTSSLDRGAFQLRQGLQRRIGITLTHSCSHEFRWRDTTSCKAGQIRLIDSSGQIPDLAASRGDVIVSLLSEPVVQHSPDGTTIIRLLGQWDSSAHNSLLLDRITHEKYRIQLTIFWTVPSPVLVEPLRFAYDIAVQVRPRTWVRAPSMLSQFWSSVRSIHATTGTFTISLRPNIVKSTLDLWRMDTKHDYVKGEEGLQGWSPRGVSLIRDYISQRRRQVLTQEIEATRSIFGNRVLDVGHNTGSTYETNRQVSSEERRLLTHVLEVWQHNVLDPSTSILRSSNINPPMKGAAFAAKVQTSIQKEMLFAAVEFLPKNPTLLKSGYVLTPDRTQTRWSRRYLELRRPFLHIYAAQDGDELEAINIRDARINHQPHISQLPQNSAGSYSTLNIFAIYARQASFLFATKTEREKLEWILRLDESYFTTHEPSVR